jgi:hypothetical protein
MINTKHEIRNPKQFRIFKIQILILFGIWCLGFGISAQASQVIDPTDVGVGARPLGMGRSFSAVADDGSAVFINPAGLSGINAMSMSGNMMGEAGYTVFGGSYPVGPGTLGVGYVGIGASGINETNLVNGTPEVTGNSGSFTNSSINLSYGSEMKDIPFLSNFNIGNLTNTRLGATLKMVNMGFSGLASAEGKGGSGIDMDLGFIANVDDDTKAALTIKNLIPGNNFGGDELPMRTVLGLSKNYPNTNLLTTIDLEYNRSLLMNFGVEWSPAQMLRVRAGLDQEPNAGSILSNFTAGLGLIFKGFTFDYAYHTYAEIADMSTHFFSIGYRGEVPKISRKAVSPLKPIPEPTLKPYVPPPATITLPPTITTTTVKTVKVAPKKAPAKKTPAKKKR